MTHSLFDHLSSGAQAHTHEHSLHVLCLFKLRPIPVLLPRESPCYLHERLRCLSGNTAKVVLPPCQHDALYSACTSSCLGRYSRITDPPSAATRNDILVISWLSLLHEQPGQHSLCYKVPGNATHSSVRTVCRHACSRSWWNALLMRSRLMRTSA